MRNPDEFDAFYKDARAGLLLQTFALTGDMGAARSAVRDAFVVAWHHWRKISRLEDPEAWVRPHAWRHAQRRHTARLWHRDKTLEPEALATLEALGKLTVAQRKTLLLTQLTTVSMADMAREVGLPLLDAERELQTATAQFAVHRDVPTTHIRPLFEPLRAEAEAARWPRATIIRRAGAARRRTHTGVGAAAAVAALVLTGSLVTDAAGIRPQLDGRPALGVAAPSSSPAPVTETPVEPPRDVDDASLLSPEQVTARIPGRRWRTVETTTNVEGDGLVLPCQRQRYADPASRGSLIRTLRDKPRPGSRPSTVQHATEVSASPKAAKATYATTLGWYAGCAEPRMQLLSTRRVGQVGDAAMMLVLRDWNRPVRTLVVGVARTGSLTTTVVTRRPGSGVPAFRNHARMLASAVNGLCTLSEAGECATSPTLTVVRPLPVGEVPGMLAEIDLPPVTNVARPWVGTEPRKAVVNVAATRCDEADFSGKEMTNNVTRSFLIPKAKLPVQFGLTETVGSLPVGKARAFVARVRARMASCPDRALGTDVSRILQSTSKRRDLTVWRVTTEITDTESVTFLMGIVRTGTSIAQIGFVPDRRVQMPPGAFANLVERAADRLVRMPAPRKR
ncbi:hypothetical protein [Nocardioides sp.]|uniref:hypothetical protein n=1 Tax=Nocardioides sp. TaxID=35761 RepID=UPI0035668829